MNDILKELIEEFPELKEDTEKLEKVVEYLEKAKPNIEASLEFKEALRERLNNIIEIKSPKKRPAWKILVPVFSSIFIMVLIFVYYNDFTKYEHFGKEKNNTIENQENGSLENTMGDSVQQAMPQISPDDSINNEFEMLDEETFGNIEKTLKESRSMLKWIEPTLLEETQKMELLQDDNWAQFDTWNIEIQVEDINNWPQNYEMQIEKSSTISNETMQDSVNPFWVYSFEEYCKSQSWIIVNTAKGKSCRASWQECLIDTFDPKWKCEFVPFNKIF